MEFHIPSTLIQKVKPEMYWENAVIQLVPLKENNDPDLVTLLVGEEDEAQSFFLHKTLLQLSSVRFKTLLSENKNSYSLPGVSPNIFEEIVTHIYTFLEWEFNGKLIEACSLLKAALDFDLEELTYSIHKTISKLTLEEVGLTCETASFVYDVVRNTSFVDEGKLKNIVLSYICKNAKLILTLDSFLHLSLDGLLEILRRDDLHINSELDVFKVVISWGMKTLDKNSKCYSHENLQEVLREPIKLVRISNMSTFESQHYVQQLSFPPVNHEMSPTEVSVNEEIRPKECTRFLFLPAEESSIGSSGASAEKPSKYSQSARSFKNDLEPTAVDILQAELYVSSFKFQVENSVLKSKLSELNKKTRLSLALQESSQHEVEEMTAQMKVLKIEISKVRAEATEATKRAVESEKIAAKSETIFVLGGEWRSFIKDSMNLSLGHYDDVMVVIKNNTTLKLQNPRREGMPIYCNMPQSIAPFTRGQFSFRKTVSTESIVMFSYSASSHNLVVGVRTNSVDDFVVGFNHYCFLKLDNTYLSSDLFTKLQSQFWKAQGDNKNKTGIVATRKFPPYLSPITTIRAVMTAGVLKIMIFQE